MFVEFISRPKLKKRPSRGACMNCRYLKIDCDGLKPICEPCRRRGLCNGCECANGSARSRTQYSAPETVPAPSPTIISPTPRAFTFPLAHNLSDSPYSSPSHSPFERDWRAWSPLSVSSDNDERRTSPLLSTFTRTSSPPVPAPRKATTEEQRPRKGDYVKRPENAFILFRRKCIEDRAAALGHSSPASFPNANSTSTSSMDGGGIAGGMGTQYPKQYSIFVGDLAPETSNSDLLAVFRNPVLGLRNDRAPKFIRPFASCKSAKITLDPVTGVSRGYGFVRFTDEADRQRALIEMHGLYCLSRPMHISPATAKFKLLLPDLGQGGPLSASAPSFSRVFTAPARTEGNKREHETLDPSYGYPPPLWSASRINESTAAPTSVIADTGHGPRQKEGFPLFTWNWNTPSSGSRSVWRSNRDTTDSEVTATAISKKGPKRRLDTDADPAPLRFRSNNLLDPMHLDTLEDVGGMERFLKSDMERFLESLRATSDMGLGGASLARSTTGLSENGQGDGGPGAGIDRSKRHKPQQGEDTAPNITAEGEEPTDWHSAGAFYPSLDVWRRIYGEKILPHRATKSLLSLMHTALKDKVLVLFSLAMGLYPDPGRPRTPGEPRVDWVEGVTFMVMILLVVIVGSVNDRQKERHFQALEDKKEKHRGCVETVLDIKQVVAGDIALLDEAGVQKEPSDFSLDLTSDVIQDELDSSSVDSEEPLSLSGSDLSSGDEASFMNPFQPINLKGRIVQDDPYPFAAGGYANVYRGTFTRLDGCKIPVAMKMILPRGGTDEALNFRRIKREASIWALLEHKNLVPFIGVCDDIAPYPVLISPLYQLGDIEAFLRKNPTADRPDMVLGVVSGLEYLHDHGVVHGDLKPSNVLVDEHFVPHICDFGISKILNHPGFTTASLGTFAYMAPELFLVLGSRGYEGTWPSTTTKSDVYSFALLALEILTSEPPRGRPTGPFVTTQVLSDLLANWTDYGHKVTVGETWSVLDQCLAFDPAVRPAISDVRYRLSVTGHSGASALSLSSRRSRSVSSEDEED